MARISTYIKDAGLIDKDLLVGSNYVSGTVGQEVYETTNFTLKSIREFVSSNIVGSVDGVSYITENVQLDGSTAKRSKVCSFPAGTTIVDSSFASAGFTSITLPSGLVTIGNNAFQNNNLTSVTIPDTVTSIGSLAFYYNGLLTTVNIPSGVTSIGLRAFESTNLTFTDLTISDSCSIGVGAFKGSTEVTGTLTLGDNIVLGNDSFETGTFNNIIIGDNVSCTSSAVSSEEGAFTGAAISGSVTIGDNIDFGNESLFYQATATAATPSISFGPNFSNGQYAFKNSPFELYTFTGNTANTIPNGITINDFMFQYSGITSLTVGDNVTLNRYSFASCVNITSLTLGDNVTMAPNSTQIAGHFQFMSQNISGGIAVTIPGTTTLAIGSFQYANISSLTIQSGITEIPNNCFQLANSPGSITSLSIPSTVLTFGDYCFYNQELPGLTTLTLGSAGNPVTVGINAFYSATDLTTVNLPTGSTVISSFPPGTTINFY